MEIIKTYFPDLSTAQIKQFEELKALYAYWNERVNVISRKDIDNLYEKHVLHSLGIAMVMKFQPEANILDVGTGGGFPGIPLAILFPESQFHLVDSIGKKIMVVQQVAQGLGLKNVKAEQARAEQIRGVQYDFVVSRAVARLSVFYNWIRDKFKSSSIHPLNNGLLYLKGGDLTDEIQESKLKGIQEYALNDYFSSDFFETKKVVYVPNQLSLGI